MLDANIAEVLPDSLRDLISSEEVLPPKSVERTFIAGLIPGLLQTARYIEAVKRTGLPQSGTTKSAFAVSRTYRQTLLLPGQHHNLEFLIEEAALRCHALPPVDMIAQLRHLTEMASRPNVSLRVIPFTAGLHPVTSLNFITIESGSGGALYLGLPYPGTFAINHPDFEQYQSLFEGSWQMALDEEASVAFIGSIADSLG